MGKRKKDPAETREQRAERKRKLCEAGEWTQCMCFLARKGRFCNMARAGGTLYCGVHFGEGGLASARGPGGRARVPCPLDPSHTVFADQVAAHVRVCTAARARDALARAPYYERDANGGRAGAAGGGADAAALADAAVLVAYLGVCAYAAASAALGAPGDALPVVSSAAKRAVGIAPDAPPPDDEAGGPGGGRDSPP